jgi:hypothetical protein
MQGALMSKKTYTRRDKKDMSPEILGRFHDLVMINDSAGYENLLDEYRVDAEDKAELMADFRRVAEDVLRRRWLRPKSR